MKQQFESVTAMGNPRGDLDPGNAAQVSGNISFPGRPTEDARVCSSIRALARYGFILLGLPNIMGFAVVTGLVAIALPTVPAGKKGILLAFAEALSGFVSIFASISIARLARVEPTLWIFAIPVTWFFVYFIHKNRVPEFFRSTAGVLSGWFLWRLAVPAG